jgi:hypothetical protein
LCQNGGLTVLSSIGETEESKVGGDNSYIVLGQTFPGEERSEIVCCDATASSFVSKVVGEVFAHFHAPLTNHCQGLHRTFSEICTKSDAVPLSDPSRNVIRANT